MAVLGLPTAPKLRMRDDRARSTPQLLGKQIPCRLGSWRGRFALTATLSFQFALSANLWFKPAVEAWNGCIDMKRVIREQLPTYGSKRCQFMVQVSAHVAGTTTLPFWTPNIAV